ncbi:MAG: TonB-dependent receptor, plug [Gemmatimonadetes bacterium]|nr:TonB-dependent receptor, plug [Gemmatimonadota bacterium]
MGRSARVAALTILLAAATTGWAQTTTGRMIGTAVDEAGAPLPGVNVTIASAALIGGAQSRVTDGGGEFAFLLLAPGDYTVRAELSGFVTQERAEVKVPLGGAAAITIAMPTGTFSGEIEVLDDTPVVDPTQVSTGQVFERSYMQDSAIGSTNRDYLTVVNQAAGVVGGLWEVPQYRVFGSTIGENAFVIDGMDTTDPLMGTATVTMNFDAVDEIQLLAGGFEAEHGRATGGIINSSGRPSAVRSCATGSGSSPPPCGSMTSSRQSPHRRRASTKA